MPRRDSESILLKIDADISDAKRKLAQLDKEADRTAGNIERRFAKVLDPATLRVFSLLQGRLPTAGPSAPSFDGHGRPLSDERIRPGFLRTGLLGGSAGDDALFGGAAFDEAEDTLVGFTRRLRELPGGFEAARQAAEDYGGETRSLNGLLEQSNLQFTKQTGLLGALRQLVPELGGDFVKLFDETTEQGRELNRVILGLGTSFIDTFTKAAFEGRNLSDVLRQLAEDILRILQSGGGGSFLGGLFGSIFGGLGGGSTSSAPASTPAFSTPAILAAKGGVFDKGKLQRFAAGGVLGRPTLFPLADGVGLAGEAGPEAVLPLTRLRDGRLGVRASLPRIPDVPARPASSAVNQQVVFNIDARGADLAAIQRLERVVQRIDSTLERRAVGAVMSSRRRGGNIARAFGAR